MRFFLIVLVVCMMPLSMLASGELSNRRAPGFSIPDSKIQQHDLADYRGKVVLLEFMQTMCPSCIKLSGILEEVNRKYTGRVQVLSVVVPPTDNTGTVGTFIREHGITYPILFDCGQVGASYWMATPQRPGMDMPHIFLIDQNGYIRNDFGVTALTKEIFEGRGLFAEVDRVLSSAPAPAKK